MDIDQPHQRVELLRTGGNTIPRSIVVDPRSRYIQSLFVPLFFFLLKQSLCDYQLIIEVVVVVVCGCVCGRGGGDWPHAYGTVDMPLLVFRHNNFIDVCDISLS